MLKIIFAINYFRIFYIFILLFMNKFKYHILGWFVFLGTVLFWYIWYTAFTTILTQENWATLNKDIWNNLVTAINDIWARTDWIYSNWGNIWIWTNTPSWKLDVNWNLKISWIVTNSQQPSFNVYSPSVTTNQNTVIWTSIRHNIWNHYNVSNWVFTAPIAWLYHFDFSILMKSCSWGSNYIRMLWKINWVKTTQYWDSLTNSVSSSFDSVNMSITIKLNAWDTVAVHNDWPVETYWPEYWQFSWFLVY